MNPELYPNLKAVTPRKVFETYLFEKPDKVIDRISPSQLGKCHRAHFLKIRHVPPTIKKSVAELANFELGFVWEEMIKNALDQQKIPYQFQTEFYDPELNMSGTSDFIIGDPKVEAYMWDSKTMKSKWFWYRQYKKKAGKFDPWAEDYLYIIQQAAYILMAKRQNMIVPSSTLFYIDKDNSFIGDETIVSLTQKVEKEVLKRIKEMNHYLAHDILPPCTCEGWQVGYCDYGNPNTREKNKGGKMVSTECCGEEEEMEKWRASDERTTKK